MNIPKLFINNADVSLWAEWHAAEVVLQRDTERLTLAIQLQGVKVVGDAFAVVQAAGVQGVSIKVQWAGLTFTGKARAGDIAYGRDYAVISADLDTLAEFSRLVEGRLLPLEQTREVRILIEPKEDKATILILFVSIFIVTYVTVQEIFSLGRDLAVIFGITGAGVGGPVSGPAALSVIIALRAAYIAALVVALVQLVRTLLELIPRIRPVRGFRVGDALRYFAQAGGLQVQVPTLLENVWVLFAGSVESFEATEVFRIAKVLTNSVLFVQGTTIKFVPATGDLPASFRRAWEETYTHAPPPRRTLVSLVRDVADDHTAGIPAAVEIVRNAPLTGLDRRDIPLAPAAVAGERPLLEALRKFLQAIQFFSQRIRRIVANLADAPTLIITERMHFVPKIVYSPDPENVAETHTTDLLQAVAQNYKALRIRRKCEGIRIPFTAQDWVALEAAQFAGVQELRWKVAQDFAEITYTYLEPNNPSIQENTTII